MPKDFLSNNIAHPHHLRAIWTGVATVIIFGFVIWGYIITRPTADPIPTTAQSLDNTPVPLTSEEVQIRQELLERDNTPVKLTPEEIQARKEVLESQ